MKKKLNKSVSHAPVVSQVQVQTNNRVKSEFSPAHFKSRSMVRTQFQIFKIIYTKIIDTACQTRAQQLLKTSKTKTSGHHQTPLTRPVLLLANNCKTLQTGQTK